MPSYLRSALMVTVQHAAVPVLHAAVPKRHAIVLARTRGGFHAAHGGLGVTGSLKHGGITSTEQTDMKILLIGEYSNVHWTLAEGLRALGHDVTVVSNGDGWKNYPRDVSLCRRSLRPADTLSYLMRLLRVLPRLRGYDVVQLINPVFLDLKAEHMRPFYRFLRRHNGKLFLGAFGMDHYWVRAGLDDRTFRYSDFHVNHVMRRLPENEQFIRDWLHGAKGRLNRFVAEDCDGIVSGLYEYDASYRPHFPEKTRFIPFPIDVQSLPPHLRRCDDGRVRFFIGIQRERSAYKGTDIMLKALLRLKETHPQIIVERAESVPFREYCRMMDASHVLLDQLYSYTPAMNALQAMAQGLVVVGGGEEENYAILHETELRPLINVLPSEDDVYERLRFLAEHPEEIARLSLQSRRYIERHHDHLKVARQYVDFWLSRG